MRGSTISRPRVCCGRQTLSRARTWRSCETELTAAAPPVSSEGVSADAPLVVKGPDGVEYRFTGLGVDDSLGKEKIDVAAHLKVEQIGDPAAARQAQCWML